MSTDFVDRSQGYEETVTVEFATGPRFRIPEGCTIRECCAHLLTPDIDEKTDEILRRIHEAAEDKIREEEHLNFQIDINGEVKGFNTKLEGEKIFQINISEE